MNTLFTIVICFMFLSALLLLGIIYSRIHWFFKAGLIVGSLAFALLFYSSVVAMLGYPVATTPPKVFRFLASIVREPSNGDPGVITLWLIDIHGRTSPRAIELPFSKPVRDLTTEAKKRLRDGQIVYMGTPESDKKPGGNRSGQPTDLKPNSTASPGSNPVPYHVRGDEELRFVNPPDTLPPKSTTED